MEFRENEAIYMQIAAYVTENVMLDEWLPEQKLPSVRELAAELQVNPLTVVRAYEFLQGRQVIANKRGIGFFITSDARQKIKHYRKERFLTQELPELFKSMYMLELSVEEIGERYEIFKKQHYQTK